MRQRALAQRLERMQGLAHKMALRLVQVKKDLATAVLHLMPPVAGAPMPVPCWPGRRCATLQTHLRA